MDWSSGAAEPERFYDGGTAEEPPDPTSRPRVLLERVSEDGDELFVMRRRVAYLDEEEGELLVPKDLATFRTDLASVPSAFTWLVPRTGRHLPAALVHDALVDTRDHIPSYVSTDGRVVDRERADRVFRRAMRDTYTRPVRRWLIWSAVSLATIWAGSGSWSAVRHAWLRVVMVASLGAIALTGVVATLDLLDVVAWLPWMGERPWWLEVLGGAAVAFVAPCVLSLAWGRLRVAGAITGVAIAFLLHVSAAILALTLLYRSLEEAVGRAPRLTALAAAIGLALSLVLAVALSAASR